jgi:hypothetical protein
MGLPMQSAKLAALSAVVAALTAAFAATQSVRAENYLCRQQFALCTSAPCIPEPGNPKVAMCSCDVEDGPNLASVACDTVKPSTDANGVRTVYSQFALKQWQLGKKTLTCPAGTPWTWCLNKPCTVDPANPKKAMCACDVVREGEWITAGGNCNTATLQYRILVGSSGRCVLGRHQFPAQIPQHQDLAGQGLPQNRGPMRPVTTISRRAALKALAAPRLRPLRCSHAWRSRQRRRRRTIGHRFDPCRAHHRPR